jgi:hypothetical protein
LRYWALVSSVGDGRPMRGKPMTLTLPRLAATTFALSLLPSVP